MEEAYINHGNQSHPINEKCKFCEMVRREFDADFARFNWDVVDFLRESNNIENEWDDLSLQQAICAWDFLIGENTLTQDLILKTHNILMAYHLRSGERGHFRQQQVWIGGREGKPWYVVPELIEQWCMNVNDLLINHSEKDSEKTLERIVREQHVTYETIHPFVDGNGRTGRIFLNWTRVKLGLPVLVIKEKEKGGYYGWFK